MRFKYVVYLLKDFDGYLLKDWVAEYSIIESAYNFSDEKNSLIVNNGKSDEYVVIVEEKLL